MRKSKRAVHWDASTCGNPDCRGMHVSLFNAAGDELCEVVLDETMIRELADMRSTLVALNKGVGEGLKRN